MRRYLLSTENFRKSFSFTNLRTLLHCISISKTPLLWSQRVFFLLGRKGQLSHSFFRYQVIRTEMRNPKVIWTNLAFPDILSWNITVKEHQKLQLQHKKILKDVEFYDEHCSLVIYRIQQVDNPNDTCNDFYSIHCQQGHDNKVLRLQNDGENLTLNSPSNEFSTQQNNPQPTVFEWAGQSINSDAHAYLQSSPWAW